MLPRLILRSSPVHGCGCYTLDPVRKGARVAEYDGLRMTKAEADERYAERDITYLFGIHDRDTVIDGYGTAMFINHCCEPNCQTEEDDGHVYILAIRNIAAGEELTYEYHLYDSDEDDQPCYCGTEGCRGTMFSEAEHGAPAAFCAAVAGLPGHHVQRSGSPPQETAWPAHDTPQTAAETLTETQPGRAGTVSIEAEGTPCSVACYFCLQVAFF